MAKTKGTKADAGKKNAKPAAGKAPGKGAGGAKKGDKPGEVKIDFAGLDQRVVACPVPPGDYRDLKAGAAGQVLYLKSPADTPAALEAQATPPSELHRFDVAKRKDETLRGGVNAYRLTPDGKKTLTFTAPAATGVTTYLDRSQLPSPTDGSGVPPQR